MKTQGILVASFGTSHKEAEKKSILALEQRIARAYPQKTVYRAYTSSIVRGILEKRNAPVPSVEEAMEALEAEGITEVFVQPTHLIYGEEYEKAVAAAKKYGTRFHEMKIGKPLLGDTEDMRKTAKILRQEYPMQPFTAIVLMGHGTEHYCNTVYAAMEYVCHEQGCRDMFVGTVEAYPDLKTVIKKVKAAGFQKAVLVPFMLTAGDHVQNDMAGSAPTSWLNQFRKAGIETTAILKGLGEYPDIAGMYMEHIENS